MKLQSEFEDVAGGPDPEYTCITLAGEIHGGQRIALFYGSEQAGPVLLEPGKRYRVTLTIEETD